MEPDERRKNSDLLLPELEGDGVGLEIFHNLGRKQRCSCAGNEQSSHHHGTLVRMG